MRMRFLSGVLSRAVQGLGAVGGTAAVLALARDPDGFGKRGWQWFRLEAEADAAKKPENLSFPKWDVDWDKRNLGTGDENNNTTTSNTASTASRHLLLIRHGQYNLDGTTDKERILTQLGREQAKTTGERLAALKLPYSYIQHSSMSRAIETANIISSEIPEIPVMQEDSILNEGPPIIPEPRVISWKPEYQYETEGARIEAAFRKYFHRADPKQTKDSYEIIVCHANVIRYFWCRALQFPPEAWLRLSLRHASITHVVISPNGKVHCRALGESGHIPPEQLSFS